MLRFPCLNLLDVVWCRDFSIVRIHNTICKDRVKSQQALEKGEQTGVGDILRHESLFAAYESLHSSCNLGKMSQLPSRWNPAII